MPEYVVGLNTDLVQLLLDRDELYMQQDSFLVDIDDLNRSVATHIPVNVLFVSQCIAYNSLHYLYTRGDASR